MARDRRNINPLSPINFKMNTEEYEALRTIPLYNKSGFECCKGWYDLLYDLGQKINSYCKENNLELPRIQQIKEKFGTLRFYYAWQVETDDKHKEQVREWVRQAENLTETTCEFCGAEAETIVYDGGIVAVRCPEHTPEGSMSSEEYRKVQEERARMMRKCDVCGEKGADTYVIDDRQTTNRCEKHREDLLTHEEYWDMIQAQKVESESV